MDQKIHPTCSCAETSDTCSTDSEDYKTPEWEPPETGTSGSDPCDSDYKDAECNGKMTSAIQQEALQVKKEALTQPVPLIHHRMEGSMEQPTLLSSESTNYRWRWKFWKHEFEFENVLAVENKWHPIVSTDANAFRKIVLCLCSKKNPSNILGLLHQCIENTFASDFPFYLIILQWLCRMKEPENYQVKSFRKKCAIEMEKMDQNLLIGTLTAFIKTNDFAVALHEGEESVFHLLRDSCMQMSAESCSEKRSSVLYRKLLWISIILRCDMECTTSYGMKNIWNTHLLKDKDLEVFNNEAKEDIKKGFRLIEFLHIAPEYKLSDDQLVALATERKRWIEFDEIMNYAIAIADCIPQPWVFLLRLYYKYIDKVTQFQLDSKEDSCIHLVEEGLHFVNNFGSLLWRDGVQMINEEQCQHERALLQWLLQITLAHIGRSTQAVQCLKLFFGREKLISDLYSHHLMPQAIEGIKKTCTLTQKLLHSIYETAIIWPNEILQKYCSEIRMSSGTILKPEWIRFLTLITTKFPDAGEHRFLLELFKRYSKSCEAHNSMAFITDMMQLNVPNLFAQGNNSRIIQEEFMSFLQDFINRNSLRETLLNTILQIITEYHQDNEFCEIVEMALQKVVAPEMHEMSRKSEIPVVLQGAINELQQESRKKAPMYVKEFCWSIVAKCCSTIVITEMDFGWIEMQYKSVYALCTLKPTVSSQSSDKNISEYFKWLDGLKDILLFWKKKIIIGDCNYDEILLCKAYQKELHQLEDFVVHNNPVVSWRIEELERLFERQIVNLNKALVLSTSANSDLCITLHQVLCMHNVDIPANVSEYLILPGLSCPTGKLQNSARLESIVQAEIHHKVCVQVNNATTMTKLNKIVQDLDNFLWPLKKWIVTLAYFGLNKCAIFNKCMEVQLREQKQKESPFYDEDTIAVQKRNKVCDLAERTEKAISCVVKLIEGKLTYSQIVTDQHIDVIHFDIHTEFDILKNFPNSDLISIECSNGIHGLKDLFEVFQLPKHIDCIHAVCKQYKLEGCLTDPIFIKLVQTAEYLKSNQSKQDLTPVDAVCQLKKLKEWLCYNTPNAEHCIDLFTAVADCAPFHSFVLQMKFDGEDGRILFGQQYQLVTAQLQHEEYNEDVLNHLTTAYNLITPFLNTKQNFQTLMRQVTVLDISHGLTELQTVNENITTIHVWFSRVEGDTFENLSREIDSISQTATYEFSFQQQCSVILSLVCSEEKQMSREQLNDFMRRLGFLDAGGEKIKQFRQLNEMADKLLNLYTQLAASGHSNYLQGCIRLRCDINNLKDKADEAMQILLNWRHELATMRCINSWLMFFSIPKLLLIYKKLQSELHRPTDDFLFHEIGFLFKSDLVAVKELNTMIKALMEKPKDLLKSESQIGAVSSFIADLLTNHTLQIPVLVSNQSPTHEHFTIQLHSCSIRSLIPTILSIFKGVPAVFQVFQCHEHSTEDELSLFLQRAEHHAFLHVLLEINKLSFQLQEFLIQYFGRRHSLHSNKTTCQVLNVELLETSHSSLRELPWIINHEYKDIEKCPSTYLADVIPKVQLIHGKAGDGKTHYITKMIASSKASAVICINEAFTLLSAIKKLRCLPYEQDCAVHVNFLLIPIHINTEQRLFASVWQFFFELFVLGYLEDPNSGLSFRLPTGLNWTFYIEVPCHSIDQDSHLALEQLCDKIPLFNSFGTPLFVSQQIPFSVTPDVQLVCKYLKAYQDGRIDNVLTEDDGDAESGDENGFGNTIIKFSTDPNLKDGECENLLKHYAGSLCDRKITLQLFVKYMYERCKVLDKSPYFNYNTGIGEMITHSGAKTDTRHLGSTILSRMLIEVHEFCDSAIIKDWNKIPHHQLIYEIRDDGASMGFITSKPEELSNSDKAKLHSIGVKIPSIAQMHSREHLDGYLSRALNIPLQGGVLKAIDDEKYVLTLDYTIKMLSIHERCRCKVPVIIQGETGVGKTALLKMLSVLWNHSFIAEWNTVRSRLCDFLESRTTIANANADKYREHVRAIQMKNAISSSDLLVICQQNPDFNKQLRNHLLQMRQLFIISLLQSEGKGSLKTLFKDVETSDDPQATANLLLWMCSAQLKTTFHKILMHSALMPKDINATLKKIIEEANMLKELAENVCETQSYVKEQSSVRVPTVILFLDEINTSSCLGLLKELIVDQSLNGEPIPDNVFIVAACNPHCGSSLASHNDGEWLRGSYYVNPLPPTLQLILWDYGSLNKEQEKQYIDAKMKMLNYDMTNLQIASLSNCIVISQELMREYAFQQLKSNYDNAVARSRSYSCVSQRDIERVLQLYQWLLECYATTKHKIDRTNHHRYAVLIALGLVYFMRLNKVFRDRYQEYIDSTLLPGDISFQDAFNQELNYYSDSIELAPGIARTQALKENIFAIIVCTVTRIPLIIVGAPGSSKTLSFNIVVSNLKGQESKKELFRMSTIFPSLDPHYYQCSKRTTSTEVETVFLRAINRQLSHLKMLVPSNCVVFMDEAGLPEESHESLKVLHYYLDKSEVSFVAITNHVLDAAKTNRAISLFRPESAEDDLEILAKGCLNSTNPSENEKVACFCDAYLSITKKDFPHFGLRDFIHFINYLRRFTNPHENFSTIVMKGLERNFNGFENFEVICNKFLEKIEASLSQVKKRHILEILHESLNDRPNNVEHNNENEIRYKLIIDPSEDDSLVRLLFMTRCLDRQSTRVFISSDLFGDNDLQKVNTITAIIHSMREGHTIVMAQTDDIHESFYDLFNQHFRKISDPIKGTRYYTNIAIGAHSKPCRVHPSFQCIVVVKKSEVLHMPPPFLNRFEKFCLTHHSILDAALQQLPPYMSIILGVVRDKVEEFTVILKKEESFYGLKTDTVASLLLSIMPVDNYTFKLGPIPLTFMDSSNVLMKIIQSIQYVLQKFAGFQFLNCTMEELELDCKHLLSCICADSVFDGLMHKELPVSDAVSEAFLMLNTYDIEKYNSLRQGMSPCACLVVSVLVQWLVRYLCKRLMQVMSPEALTIHREKIASTYIKNYLQFQVHFSLKKLIDTTYRTLQIDGESYRPTKLLCYTRSSSVLHKLPMTYPYDNSTVEESKKLSRDSVQELVFDTDSSVMIIKLSRQSSASSVMEVLQEFGQNKSTNILLIIVNIQDVSIKAINHVRIMIEEAENKTQLKNKLYVLLLHFSRSAKHYPTLFLSGWNHHYIDTISSNSEKGILDVEYWFKQCCFSPPHVQPDDSLTCTLRSLLHESIPIITSQVTFGNIDHRKAPFNTKMSICERRNLLHQLLFTKRIGFILCDRFRSYWTPSIMASYVEQAASFSHSQQSTLSISAPIHTSVKVLFFDFMVHMIALINNHCNLDLLFAIDCPQSVEQLFVDILHIYPIPSFEQLKKLNNIHMASHMSIPDQLPTFPFIHMVLMQMDHLVENCREEMNKKVDLLTENIPSASSNTTIFNILDKAADKDSSDDCLAITWKAINGSQDLWHRYFNDFSYYKMNLFYASELDLQHGLVKSMLHVNNDLNNSRKMLRLHAYISEHQVDVAKMATILRPLGILNRTLGSLNANNVKALSAESNDFQSDYAFIVSSFIVDALFGALPATSFAEVDTTKASNQLKNWQCAYRDTLTLPSMKEHIYGSLNLCMRSTQGTDLKGKFDIMQAMFAVMQWTNDNSTEWNAQQLRILGKFHSWISSAKIEIDQKSSSEPQQHSTLAQIVLIVMKELPGSHWEKLIEKFFNHFFCELHTSGYNQSDCEFFLQMANEQYQWLQCVNHSTMPATLQASHISINLFKLYLTRILMCKQDTDQLAEPCCLYPKRLRAMVAKVLLSASNLGKPGNYIPMCYQLCPNISIKEDTLSNRMNQPLAHLYFLTVLESFQKKYSGYNVAQLATMVQYIKRGCSFEDDENTILLFIELQAAIQVFIQQLALQFDPDNSQKMHSIVSIMEDINSILADTTTGGGVCRGHSHVLLLHALKNLKHEKFFNLLTEKYDSMCQDIYSFHETNIHLKSFSLQPQDILPLFLNQQEMVFYDVIKQLMTDQCIPDLLKVAGECKAASEEKEGLFRMMVWLVAYYEFYDKEITLPSLSDAIEAAEFTPYFETGEIRLIQSFINPSTMVNNPEICSENIDYDFDDEHDDNDHYFDEEHDDNDERHAHAQDSIKEKEKRDPVQEFFMLKAEEDVHMRHALANLTGAILASPRKGNTLWYHLFAPDELYDTYIPGFLIEDCKVNGYPYHYDCGIVLDTNGLPDRAEYRSPSCSMNSYYLLLWANIGAICMGLLTQPDTDMKIQVLFSSFLSLRHYCVSSIRKLWFHFHDKERSERSPAECIILVSKCIKNFHEENYGSFVSKHIKSKCDTVDEVMEYEVMWQNMFDSALNTELEQHSQNVLVKEIIVFRKAYPLFHTMDEVKHSVHEFQQCDVSLLKQFILNYDRICFGEQLLPDIVEFYQWLHMNLAHIVTVEKAAELPIHGVVSIAAKRMLSNQSILALYNRLKSNYNLYVQTVDGMIGADVCRQSNQISLISDETPLLHFLSDTVEPEQGNDCLYNVLVDIVNTHNELIERLERKAQTENLVEVIQLLPSVLHRIAVAEFSESHCIVRQKYTSFLELAHSRCCHSTQEIDFTLLQEDVIRLYYVGKPILDHPKSIRAPFKFCSSTNMPHNPTFATNTSEETIIKLKEKLPAFQQTSSEDPVLKEFEFEFHCADYSALHGALQFLSIVLGHLYMTSSETESIKKEVVTQKVHQFLEHLGDLHGTAVQHTTNECSQSQVDFLHNLPVYLVVECYEQSMIWLKEEIYDFHDFPFAVKSHLLPEDKKKLQEVPSQWKGDLNTLTKELSCMVTNLIHSEEHLIKTTNEGSQTSIVQFLHEASCFEDTDLLPSLIPSSISVKHYVYFRIEIKRLIASISNLEMNRETNKWHEVIEDLWKGQLQHLRDFNYSITHDSNPIAHGFGEVKSPENGLEEDFRMFVHSKDHVPPLIQLIDSDAETVLTATLASTHENSKEEADHGISPDLAECFLDNVSTLGDKAAYIATTDNNVSAHEFSEEEVARAISTDVVDFFSENNVPADDNVPVSGKELLLMTKDKITDVFKIDPIAALKVYILFRRKIRCMQAIHDISSVKAFLQKEMLESYINKFEYHKIDGDMLLEADGSILKRIGVKKCLHCIKIKVLFPRYLHNSSPCCSCETISEWLKDNGMEQYIPMFQQEKIDGDIMQKIDEKCLKELNVDEKDMDMILQLKYKLLQST